jgi:murein DD-endopeptidase MepM/ murein hydrolase activator NlpD
MAAHSPHRRLALVLGAGLLAVAGLPVVAIMGLAGVAGRDSTAPGAGAAAAGMPARAAQAYQSAAGRCEGLDWTLLAAIGAVETNHGQHAGAALDPATGEARPWIFGPALNGQNHTAAIPIDRWSGWWGLTGPWQRAIGPMQFLPTTFDAHAVDADQDGTTNPHDIDDAVATTANYICASAWERVDGTAEVARIYNPGDADNYAAKLDAERRRIIDAGAAGAGEIAATLCPVAGRVTFTDTWGASRSDGRSHKGVDMFADEGTPVIAVAPGRVEHYNNNLGGLSYRLYADDGTFYYGTHLSAYENEGAGHVEAGTVIGYVGRTGNAATTPPHLHWEIHPGGRGSPAMNPTPTADDLCTANRG